MTQHLVISIVTYWVELPNVAVAECSSFGSPAKGLKSDVPKCNWSIPGIFPF